MISRPPELGDKKSEQWIKEFLGYFEKIRFEFQKVNSIWWPVQGTSVHGKHPAKQITAGNSAFISAVIPRQVNKIKEAVLRLIPSVTGTIDWTANIAYGDANEDENLNTATMTADGLAVTDDRITEIEITDLFNNIDRNDQAGIEFVLDAVNTTTDVYVLGVYFKYN